MHLKCSPSNAGTPLDTLICFAAWCSGSILQLGHGDDHCSAVPRVIEALRASDSQGTGGIVTGVSAGGIHSAAVLEGGGVYTWGGSSYGQVLYRR